MIHENKLIERLKENIEIWEKDVKIGTIQDSGDLSLDTANKSGIVRGFYIVDQLAEEYKNESVKGDLISRSALLEKLNDTGVQITFDLPVEEILGEDVDIDDFSMLVQDAVQAYRKMIIDTIHNQPTVYNDDWIPCNERLPEENQSVIACFAHGTVTELAFYDGLFHGIYDYNTEVIVAWQPLPTPYKKGD